MSQPNHKSEFMLNVSKILRFFRNIRGSGFLFCACDNSALVRQINRYVAGKAGIDFIIKDIYLTTENVEDFIQHIRSAATKKIHGMIINNLDELVIISKRKIIDYLNVSREILISLNVPILFWLSEEHISLFANRAPDLFTRRDRSVLTFSEKSVQTEIEQIDSAIHEHTGQKNQLSEQVFKITLTSLKAQKDEMQNMLKAVERSSVLSPNRANDYGIDKEIADKGMVKNGASNIIHEAKAGTGVCSGPESQDRTNTLNIYRQTVVDSVRSLPLRGVEIRAGDASSGARRMDLNHVYIHLETKTHKEFQKEEERYKQEKLLKEQKEHTVRALEATAKNRQIVLTGDPGAGKSTFIKHLTLCLASHGLEPDAGWLDQIPAWPKSEGDMIPVIVILRDLAKLKPENEERPAEYLWTFIRSCLKSQNLSFVTGQLKNALSTGKALLLLDGLDEIPSVHQRTFIRDAVIDFAKQYPQCRLIVTCRVLSYQDKAWQVPDFPVFELAPFNEKMTKSFIRNWYSELARTGEVRTEDSKGLAHRLSDAVKRSDLRQLASNPLLLTVMAIVHTHKGRLPDARSLLYEEVTDILLYRWDQIKASGEMRQPRLNELLSEAGRSDTDLKSVLSKLAFTIHQEADTAQGFVLADIKEWQLAKLLSDLHPQKSQDWAHQVINTIKLRAGLLLERAPGVYAFPHRTFQEYLSGVYLSTQADFAQKASHLFKQGPFWREVILLAVGRLVYQFGDMDKPLALVGELCPQKNHRSREAFLKTWLAGDCLLVGGLNRARDSELGKDLVIRVRKRLTEVIRKDALTPVERSQAGDVLSRIGDQRKGVGIKDGLPDIDWIKIEAGPFIMGSDDKDPDAFDREKPQFTYNLIKEDFGISRFPVTVAQYSCFIESGGYNEKKYWTKSGWAWKEENKIKEPRTYSEVFQILNHPQGGVSWYEAAAFCKWLSGKLNCQVNLPTEVQWVRAARHTDGRIYPWGNKGKPEKLCNTAYTRIGSSSPVGIFPKGNAECDASDIAGNVWEWTCSLWGKGWNVPDFKYPYDPRDSREDLEAGSEYLRVLRGGSFYFDSRDARCAYRNGYYPYYRNFFIGFRLVLSPFFL
jgi:formylglycine-generating enzyme required for sulfatase activity